jgi:hypothetical protein
VPIGAQLYCLTVASEELNKFIEIAPDPMDAKKLTKEQTKTLRRNNKIAKELSAEYRWALYGTMTWEASSLLYRCCT